MGLPPGVVGDLSRQPTLGGPKSMMSAIVPLLTLSLLPAWSQHVQPGGELLDFERRVAEAEKRRADTATFRTNYPLARLALKKARLLAQGAIFFGQQGGMEQILQVGREALSRLERGQEYRGQPGRLNELAYEAENDGSVQPYYLYLPPDFVPSRKWPLIVFLHGYVPSITVLDPWVLPGEVCDIAGRNGCLLLIPYGRRNTDFQGVGEVDVIDTMRLVQKYYPIDEQRLYLSGVSMGGMGAWNLALRRPGQFAAVTPIAGHTDMLTWWGWPRDQVAPFKKWLIEWDNPIDLVMNARGQRFFVQHGADDQLISVSQSRNMVAAARDLGLQVEYHEYRGEGHYIYWGTECFEKAWAWQKQISLGRPVREIDLKTYSLEYDQAFWLRVDRLEVWGKPAVVKIRVTADGKRVAVETQNAAGLSLNAEEGCLDAEAVFVVNGTERTPERRDGPWVSFDLAPVQAAKDFPPLKRRGLCGPAEEVFDSPFIVVQGTAGDDAQDEDLATKVGRWAGEWNAFADGYPRIATDTEIGQDDIARYNLVLFGTPETNSVLARLADKLPVRIADHDYRIGERRLTGPQLGLVLCYPNPLAPDRYVLIYSGEYYGEKLSINHKHDLLPDFLVFRGDRFEYDDANQWVCGGFFDSAWRLAEGSTWVNPAAEDK